MRLDSFFGDLLEAVLRTSFGNQGTVQDDLKVAFEDVGFGRGGGVGGGGERKLMKAFLADVGGVLAGNSATVSRLWCLCIMACWRSTSSGSGCPESFPGIGWSLRCCKKVCAGRFWRFMAGPHALIHW